MLFRHNRPRRTLLRCGAHTRRIPSLGSNLSRWKTVTVQLLVVLRRKDDSEYHRILERIFALVSAKPDIAVECDSASSLIMEVEAGRGIAVVTANLKLMGSERLLYRSLVDLTETPSVGIARATIGDVTPAGEKFCEILRQISCGASKPKPR